MYRCNVDNKLYKKVRRAKPSNNRHLRNSEGIPFTTEEIKKWEFCWKCSSIECPKLREEE
tara:strand:- start:347 stop:526 length:180 start_codon:yes stop_codon:yes gene_type:complete